MQKSNLKSNLRRFFTSFLAIVMIFGSMGSTQLFGAQVDFITASNIDAIFYGGTQNIGRLMVWGSQISKNDVIKIKLDAYPNTEPILTVPYMGSGHSIEIKGVASNAPFYVIHEKFDGLDANQKPIYQVSQPIACEYSMKKTPDVLIKYETIKNVNGTIKYTPLYSLTQAKPGDYIRASVNIGNINSLEIITVPLKFNPEVMQVAATGSIYNNPLKPVIVAGNEPTGYYPIKNSPFEPSVTGLEFFGNTGSERWNGQASTDSSSPYINNVTGLVKMSGLRNIMSGDVKGNAGRYARTPSSIFSVNFLVKQAPSATDTIRFATVDDCPEVYLSERPLFPEKNYYFDTESPYGASLELAGVNLLEKPLEIDNKINEKDPRPIIDYKNIANDASGDGLGISDINRSIMPYVTDYGTKVGTVASYTNVGSDGAIKSLSNKVVLSGLENDVKKVMVEVFDKNGGSQDYDGNFTKIGQEEVYKLRDDGIGSCVVDLKDYPIDVNTELYVSTLGTNKSCRVRVPTLNPQTNKINIKVKNVDNKEITTFTAGQQLKIAVEAQDFCELASAIIPLEFNNAVVTATEVDGVKQGADAVTQKSFTELATSNWDQLQTQKKYVGSLINTDGYPYVSNTEGLIKVATASVAPRWYTDTAELFTVDLTAKTSGKVADIGLKISNKDAKSPNGATVGTKFNGVTPCKINVLGTNYIQNINSKFELASDNQTDVANSVYNEGEIIAPIITPPLNTVNPAPGGTTGGGETAPGGGETAPVQTVDVESIYIKNRVNDKYFEGADPNNVARDPDNAYNCVIIRQGNSPNVDAVFGAAIYKFGATPPTKPDITSDRTLISTQPGGEEPNVSRILLVTGSTTKTNIQLQAEDLLDANGNVTRPRDIIRVGLKDASDNFVKGCIWDLEIPAQQKRTAAIKVSRDGYVDAEGKPLPTKEIKMRSGEAVGALAGMYGNVTVGEKIRVDVFASSLECDLSTFEIPIYFNSEVVKVCNSDYTQVMPDERIDISQAQLKTGSQGVMASNTFGNRPSSYQKAVMTAVKGKNFNYRAAITELRSNGIKDFADSPDGAAALEVYYKNVLNYQKWENKKGIDSTGDMKPSVMNKMVNDPKKGRVAVTITADENKEDYVSYMLKNGKGTYLKPTPAINDQNMHIYSAYFIGVGSGSAGFSMKKEYVMGGSSGFAEEPNMIRRGEMPHDALLLHGMVHSYTEANSQNLPYPEPLFEYKFVLKNGNARGPGTSNPKGEIKDPLDVETNLRNMFTYQGDSYKETGYALVKRVVDGVEYEDENYKPDMGSVDMPGEAAGTRSMPYDKPTGTYTGATQKTTYVKEILTFSHALTGSGEDSMSSMHKLSKPLSIMVDDGKLAANATSNEIFKDGYFESFRSPTGDGWFSADLSSPLKLPVLGEATLEYIAYETENIDGVERENVVARTTRKVIILYERGDYNLDGKIDSSDVECIANCILTYKTYKNFEILFAKKILVCDKDGDITGGDVSRLLSHIANKTLLEQDYK